jgi:TRAP-type transport system small permease protein
VSSLPSESSSPNAPRLLVVVGGGALLIALAVDALAVVGRHVGLPLLGSIELVQAAVLVSGSAALLVATLADVHARVHLLVDRLPMNWQVLLLRTGHLLSALLFLAFMAASLWIASDLWQGHEQSELLRIPYKPLRIVAVLATAAVAVVFLRQLLSGKAQS